MASSMTPDRCDFTKGKMAPNGAICDNFAASYGQQNDCSGSLGNFWSRERNEGLGWPPALGKWVADQRTAQNRNGAAVK